MSMRLKILLIISLSISIVFLLVGSLYMYSIITSVGNGRPYPQPTVSVQATPGPTTNTPTDTLGPFVLWQYPEVGNNQVYYDDTITAYIDGKNPMLVVSTYTRQQKGSDFVHTARTTFFDGNTWRRNIETHTSKSARLVSGNVIRSLDIYQAKDRVLRQLITSEIVVDRNEIYISTDTLENESLVRSEPSYTRIFSDSTGYVTINGKTHAARIMYTKWYSADNSQIPFYDKDLDLETHAFDFWADDGSVLHLDATDVKKPSPLYSPHKLGIYKDAQKRVAKTFDLTLENSGEVPPSTWKVNFLDPLNLTFAGTTFSVLKRSEGADYNWYRGLIRGTITLPGGKTIKGTGTFEYILEQ